MTTVKLRKWDSAEYLKTDEDMALYLEACFEEAGEDAAFIAKALGTIARAKGMTQLARDTGLGRESLYKALSGEGNPSFATILKVTRVLGIKLHAEVLPTHAEGRAGETRAAPATPSA
ncbi:addiction module antidote protein [Azotobacter beijerinckii]|uniref:Probable addiction module antidote protein n=1 Tax=Azotobacter beijerinckii TaxID=170623 RepID=A0A1I4GLC7_9GAMM|nr:addiction module antidote protein [Azotobacter beijerinckii]SFB64293.1 probable addiction module antidote protein [Azotobacter beijerinckii]SFL30858.1 probable addiction module antidote protein [Azotobacter beijerinckii]